MALRNAVSRYFLQGMNSESPTLCACISRIYSVDAHITSEKTMSSTLSGTASLPQHVSLLEEKVTGPYKIAQQPIFAVVEISGTQYKVTPDDLIVTEKIPGLDIHDTIKLNRVLLLGSKTETVIGRPYVPNASVTAAVEEQFLDGKVIVFKKRRRKNSRRTNGHRQPLTSLRILSVETPTTTGN